MTLDRFLAKHLGLNRRDARCLLFQRQVTVNGAAVSHHLHPITPFDQIQLDGQLLQQGQARLYFALHKPVGYVSATTDPLHPTVLDLLDHPKKKNLHLAGRLDRSSSGLVLLTNDGHWSEAITRPAEKLEKEYLVETLDPIPPSAIARFAEGFYFPTENIHTQPASLTRLSTHRARVVLTEGRYHQIKRMFHRLDGIRLRSLQRIRIGPYQLQELGLPVGQWRAVEAGRLRAH